MILEKHTYFCSQELSSFPLQPPPIWDRWVVSHGNNGNRNNYTVTHQWQWAQRFLQLYGCARKKMSQEIKRDDELDTLTDELCAPQHSCLVTFIGLLGKRKQERGGTTKCNRLDHKKEVDCGDMLQTWDLKLSVGCLTPRPCCRWPWRRVHATHTQLQISCF